jgi:cyclopropane fatty-acyl-phospholipid synthase-like methyltransferase
LNGKRGFPPIALRREIGDLDTWEAAGAEFTAYLKLLCGLNPDSRVLDIGCGCGRLARYVAPYLTSGNYTGIDVERSLIDWCNNHIADDGSHFIHIDMLNRRYNPTGNPLLRLPIEDSSMDVIVAMSVFTHLLKDDMAWYFGEISRVLQKDGRALVTVYIADLEHASSLHFPFGDEHCRFRHEASPETAVAFSKKHLEKTVREHGLKIHALCPGMWATAEGLSYQDILIIERS